jgi:hypothetical protein
MHSLQLKLLFSLPVGARTRYMITQSCSASLFLVRCWSWQWQVLLAVSLSATSILLEASEGGAPLHTCHIQIYTEQGKKQLQD